LAVDCVWGMAGTRDGHGEKYSGDRF
jgi:hypothetical protein